MYAMFDNLLGIARFFLSWLEVNVGCRSLHRPPLISIAPKSDRSSSLFHPVQRQMLLRFVFVVLGPTYPLYAVSIILLTKSLLMWEKDVDESVRRSIGPKTWWEVRPILKMFRIDSNGKRIVFRDKDEAARRFVFRTRLKS